VPPELAQTPPPELAQTPVPELAQTPPPELAQTPVLALQRYGSSLPSHPHIPRSRLRFVST